MMEAAGEDLALPYSLMLDAWDRALTEGAPEAVRTQWLACLTDAIGAYHESPTTYWKQDRINRVLATPEPIPAPPAGDDGEHW
jgi:hypothetical protein